MEACNFSNVGNDLYGEKFQLGLCDTCTWLVVVGGYWWWLVVVGG